MNEFVLYLDTLRDTMTLKYGDEIVKVYDREWWEEHPPGTHQFWVEQDIKKFLSCRESNDSGGS